MNNSIVNLSLVQVGVAYIFVVILLVILKSRGINREKELLLATVRMTLQLVFIGFVLVTIIDNPHPFITITLVLIMIFFAIYTLFRKFKNDLNKKLKSVIIVAMFGGTLPVIGFFIWVVIGVTPYYNPQYVIPIAGMLIGNSMTGISLGIHTLLKEFKAQRDHVEEALILGATTKEAAAPIVNHGFDSAIMPTLNSMLGMGIIFLPGMMTGQILSGVSPSMAILYQIAIMLGILGSVSLVTYLFLALGYKTFFNQDKQLY